MFGKSSAKRFQDPELGDLEFERSRGSWRSSIVISPFGPVPLAIPGSRHEPARSALRLVGSIPQEWQRCCSAIGEALVEHRSAYTEQALNDDGAVVPPTFVQVVTFEGEPTVEFGFQVSWDDDHTLGARVRDGSLIELNGSIVAR